MGLMTDIVDLSNQHRKFLTNSEKILNKDKLNEF